MEDEDKEPLVIEQRLILLKKLHSLHEKSQTWRELKMVNSQAKTAVFSLIANSPNTHVSPSKGNRITDAFTTELHGSNTQYKSCCYTNDGPGGQAHHTQVYCILLALINPPFLCPYFKAQHNFCCTLQAFPAPAYHVRTRKHESLQCVCDHECELQPFPVMMHTCISNYV